LPVIALLLHTTAVSHEGDLLKILPCAHTYHHLCIESWFDTQSREKTCPFCKQQVNHHRQVTSTDKLELDLLFLPRETRTASGGRGEKTALPAFL
uniref:RING-type domain-containing protein n=1 Tax=Coturnix japonica TaxID=93934 RepID=A0A8C2TUR3_COTJA